MVYAVPVYISPQYNLIISEDGFRAAVRVDNIDGVGFPRGCVDTEPGHCSVKHNVQVGTVPDRA